MSYCYLCAWMSHNVFVLHHTYCLCGNQLSTNICTFNCILQQFPFFVLKRKMHTPPMPLVVIRSKTCPGEIMSKFVFKKSLSRSSFKLNCSIGVLKYVSLALQCSCVTSSVRGGRICCNSDTDKCADNSLRFST